MNNFKALTIAVTLIVYSLQSNVITYFYISIQSIFMRETLNLNKERAYKRTDDKYPHMSKIY